MPTWCCGGGVWMMTAWIVLLVVIITGAVLLVRRLWSPAGPRTGRWNGSASRSDAMTILEERYARGAIGEQEFEERRRALGSS